MQMNPVSARPQPQQRVASYRQPKVCLAKPALGDRRYGHDQLQRFSRRF